MEEGRTCQAGCERRRWMEFELPLALYAVVGAMVAVRQRNGIHNDVVAYVRRAGYLLDGDFYHAISSYWSPLITWCIAPLMWLGMDGLYAARAVCWVWGGVLVAMFVVFLRAFVKWGAFARVGSASVVALMAAHVIGDAITPDVILGACLFAYLAAAGHGELMKRRGIPLVAGVLGGVAYLGKAYAFPFVLAHMAMTLVLRGWAIWRRGERGVMGRAVVVWGVFVAGFAMVAGPWIGVLTWRYGRLTVSSVGWAAHALVGAGPERKVYEPFEAPADPYIIAWENPETIRHGYWSPISGRRELAHQIGVIGKQAVKVGGTIWGFDVLHLGAAGMALGLVAVVAGLVGRCAEGWKAGWLVMTMSLFCLGFLPIYYAPRYIMPVVLPLSLVLSMELAMGLWGVGWRVVAAGVVLGSFGYTAGERAYEAWRKPGTMVYRNIAAEIRRHGLKGAIACNDRVRTYNLALLVGEKVVGFPADEELEVVERKLRESKVGMLIVWRGDSRQGDSGGTAKLAPELARRAAWRLVFTSHGAEVYEPAGEGGR